MEEIIVRKVIVVLVLIFTALMASDEDKNNLNIKENSKCLQFQIDSDFQLNSFQGSTISLKKHYSKNRALRIGLSLDGDVENRSYFTDSENDTLDYRLIRKYNDFNIILIGQYLKYIPREYSYLYYGFGPKIGYSNLYQKTQPEYKTTGEWVSSPTTKNYMKSFQFGLVLVAGVDIFISQSISIHGEYNQELMYKYYWSKQPLTNYDNIRKYNYLSLNSCGVKFGCSFYW